MDRILEVPGILTASRCTVKNRDGREEQSPYKALFGVEARVGLRSTAFPEEVLKIMITEEDLVGAYKGSAYPESPPCGQNHQGRLHKLQEDIALQRSKTAAGQLAQAERTVKRSRVEYVPGNPGDNVTIPIPLVDRRKGVPRNVIGVILDRNENDMYRIGVRDAILKGRYSRGQFDICSQQLYSIGEVSADKEVGLRHAVQQSSRFGGQGYAKCNCTVGKKQCQTNRCKCYKEGYKCNSRYHSGLNCKNKN
ncbi:uncharacterized protein LOC135208358 [Macrobrachium nipponense]|uniref:uncharacterized protein LOC135208358 n=1 Tax=Macrobrachium nipponense TaxID=159736 RepID=UPI0030C88F87